MESVILLNADYTFLNSVSWKSAVKLISKGKAEIVKSGEKIISNFEKTFEIFMPIVIKLVKFVRLMFKKGVPFTKRNLFIRDECICQYCGRKYKSTSKSLTIDHIVPRSRNGKSTWENCVTCCKNCNTLKSDKKISEVSLRLNKLPTKPTIGEFINVKMKALGADKILKEIFEDV